VFGTESGAVRIVGTASDLVLVGKQMLLEFAGPNGAILA